MKKYIIVLAGILTLLMIQKSKAQIAFGKDHVTNESVLVEFGPENKGIIIPSVTSAPGAVGGTFVFSIGNKAVEVWEDRDNNGGAWTALTDENQGVEHSFSNAGADVVTGSGVIIGADTTTKPGVLVLESTTRALVLPQVADPHLSIKGAVAGTIVYDTVSDTLAVYDGANWSYWK